MVDGYRGVFGAIPYAFGASDSRLFRSYVVVGTLVAALVALFVALGLVVLFGATSGAQGGAFTLSRAFYAVVGLLVVAPMLAPTLLVARRHRRGRTTDTRYDFALGASGYAFVGAMYVALVVFMPTCFTLDGQRTCPAPPDGLLRPVVSFLYGLPDAAGFVPLVLAAALIVLVHRTLR